MFFDFDQTHPPYRTGAGSCLPVDYPPQEATLIVAHEIDPSGETDISVRDSPGGVGIVGVMGLSAGPSQLGTNKIDLRKRKRLTTQDEPSEVNHTRQRGQPHLDLQQAQIQVSVRKF